MNYLLLEQIEECLSMCKRIDSLHESHIEILSRFLSGRIYEEYKQNSCHASNLILILRKELTQLYCNSESTM